MSDEPIAFGYLGIDCVDILKKQLTCQQVVISSTRSCEYESIRIAIVQVPPSITDIAWDTMTVDERMAVTGPYHSRVPEVHEYARVAEALKRQAKNLLTAANKLSDAVRFANDIQSNA